MKTFANVYGLVDSTMSTVATTKILLTSDGKPGKQKILESILENMLIISIGYSAARLASRCARRLDIIHLELPSILKNWPKLESALGCIGNAAMIYAWGRPTTLFTGYATHLYLAASSGVHLLHQLGLLPINYSRLTWLQG